MCFQICTLGLCRWPGPMTRLGKLRSLPVEEKHEKTPTAKEEPSGWKVPSQSISKKRLDNASAVSPSRSLLTPLITVAVFIGWKMTRQNEVNQRQSSGNHAHRSYINRRVVVTSSNSLLQALQTVDSYIYIYMKACHLRFSPQWRCVVESGSLWHSSREKERT